MSKKYPTMKERWRLDQTVGATDKFGNEFISSGKKYTLISADKTVKIDLQPGHTTKYNKDGSRIITQPDGTVIHVGKKIIVDEAIAKEGWITTEEGNHVYIDSDGKFQGGSAGYQAYSQSIGSKPESVVQETRYINTSTRGHLENEHMRGDEALQQIMSDTGCTPEEAQKMFDAIDDYTGSGFSYIRQAQIGGETEGKDAEYGEQLEKYIRLAPKWDGGELHRYISLGDDDYLELTSKLALSAYFGDDDPDNFIDQLGGTSSWTSDEKYPLNAAGIEKYNLDDDETESTHFVVFHTSGTKQGVSVTHLSSTQGENEVIISKNAKWKITDGYKKEETAAGEIFMVLHVFCEEVESD